MPEDAAFPTADRREASAKMSDPIGSPVVAAVAFARAGLPVFPCEANGKRPLTRHGFKDATTDERQIRAWWSKWPAANIAIPTGAPGPDVLDVDIRPDGSGMPHFERLRSAGLLRGAIRVVNTPSGGLHLWFPGTDQRSGSLSGLHLDCKRAGGYVLAPPSYVIDVEHGYEGPYVETDRRAEGTPLDWVRVCRMLNPCDISTLTPWKDSGHGKIDWLARWVLDQPIGNRNAALFWALCRALEDGHTDLAPLVVAAEAVGLTRSEIERTIQSARKRVGARA